MINKKRIVAAVLCLTAVLLSTVCAWAAPEIGLGGNEVAANGARWILSGLAWIMVVGGAISLVRLVINKNTTGIIVSLLLTVLALAFIINPTKVIELACRIPEILGI